jgi:gamma-D-glutamyl-L-lysine dipeptidyl-peptidase
MARSFVTINSVVDLRREPAIALPFDYSHQKGRETQLLFGEKVVLIEEQKEWLKVGAIEQLRFTPQEGWHPYPGWVRKVEVKEIVSSPFLPIHVISKMSSYSYGTLLNASLPDSRPLPKIPNREQIIEEARQFIGAPYLWGGRSSPLPSMITSVDCSGLINLLYRAQGIYVPRDAHDQFLASSPTQTLQPADPLYLAKNTRISHVILKLNATTYIEAPETGKTIRLLTWGTHLWEEGGRVKFFDRPSLYTPYPRTFIA